MMEGFESALIGRCFRFNMEFLVYDQDKVIEILMTQNNWSSEEAMEWFDYNIIGAWVGDEAPGFLMRDW